MGQFYHGTDVASSPVKKILYETLESSLLLVPTPPPTHFLENTMVNDRNNKKKFTLKERICFIGCPPPPPPPNYPVKFTLKERISSSIFPVFMDLILWPVISSHLCIVKIVSVMPFSYQKLMTLSWVYLCLSYD